MRKRAWHCLNPNNSIKKETYGFNSTNPAPHVQELKDFENVKKAGSDFKPVHDNFQRKLKSDIKNIIKKDDKLLIAADKTTNHYRVDKLTHREILNKNIMKEYKKLMKTLSMK